MGQVPGYFAGFGYVDGPAGVLFELVMSPARRLVSTRTTQVADPVPNTSVSPFASMCQVLPLPSFAWMITGGLMVSPGSPRRPMMTRSR